MLSLIAPLLTLAGPCAAIDGDTIRCGREVIRLIGIDAPEMPGHCRAGRACVPGDPVRAKRALNAAMMHHPITIRRFGHDRYRRTLAIVYAGRVNLSCAQMDSGNAIYKPGWDAARRVGRECQQPHP